METILLSVIAIIIIAFVLKLSNRYNFWKKRGINGPVPEFFFGNFRKIVFFQQSIEDFISDTCLKYKNDKIIGIYKLFEYGLIVKDPEFIKTVLIKDSECFQDRFSSTECGKLEDNLFHIEGVKWKVLRRTLSPLFSSGKLKKMSVLIENSATDFIKYINEFINQEAELDIRVLMAKYTIETIGSCSFGVELNTYTDKPNQFQFIAFSIFKFTYFRRLLQICDFYMPLIAKILHKYLRIPTDSKRFEPFFGTFINDIIEMRNNKNTNRNDFMDLMIELKEQGVAERKQGEKLFTVNIDNDAIAAQAYIFFAAGFETSSSTMSYLLFELAKHQEIQAKVHQEIINVLKNHDNKVNFESVKEMLYLEACFDETLRLYPIGTHLSRMAISDYDFKELNLTIEKGTQILIPVWNLHKDPKYFEDPNSFDPSRFMEPNKSRIPSCVYLPFGDGPRNCIGLRFAKLQSLIALASFIKEFQVLPSSKTEKLTFTKKAFVLTTTDGVFVNVLKRH